MKHYDIACIGGGPGGLVATLTAARKGKKVILIERNEYLGGGLTTGAAMIGFQNAVEGYPETCEVIRAFQASGAIGKAVPWNGLTMFPTNPDLIKLTCAKLCEDAGIEIRFCSVPMKVNLTEGAIQSVVCFEKGNKTEIAAECWIDATGQGTLLRTAGAGVPFEDEPHRLVSLTISVRLSTAGMEKFTDPITDITGLCRSALEIPSARVYIQRTEEKQRMALQLMEERSSEDTLSGSQTAITEDMYRLFMWLRKNRDEFTDAQVSRTATYIPAISGRVTDHLEIQPVGNEAAVSEQLCLTGIPGLFQCGQLAGNVQLHGSPFPPVEWCMKSGETAGNSAVGLLK